jgi:exopolyphosphatase/guanosine-5'-triphosphate,3'-diphosphate pyrophosphatase
MKIAIIDLGTNTFHLLIAEISNGEPIIIYKTNEPVKLGEDITKDNLIIPTAFARGINCLKLFKKTIDQHKVELIKATATSGVRSAKNGKDFVNAAKENAAITIDIINGDTEAEYIYKGIKWSGAITGLSLIMDIGGGSTEFILCNKKKLLWKKSYNIGAARLMQTFFNSDPINESDKRAIQHHLDDHLLELITICQIHKPQTLIGSAGAFETFVSMINSEIDINAISETNINFQSYFQLAKALIEANHEERAKMDGLIPFRVDMIVMASILTNYILEKLNIKQIKLSTYDLKMGVLKSFQLLI